MIGEKECTYRKNFFNSVLDFNDKTPCGIILYPVFYCLVIGFTLGILKEFDKIKIPNSAIAGIALGIFLGLLTLGIVIVCNVEQEQKYASAATNPPTWVLAPSAYFLGSLLDGAVAMKHSISK